MITSGAIGTKNSSPASITYASLKKQAAPSQTGKNQENKLITSSNQKTTDLVNFAASTKKAATSQELTQLLSNMAPDMSGLVPHRVDAKT